MKILFLNRAPLQRLPPTMNYARAASSLGHEVSYVCAQSSQVSKDNLEQAGVHVIDDLLPTLAPTFLSRNRFLRASLAFLSWVRFRFAVKNFYRHGSDFDLIWLCSADTAIPLIGINNPSPIILTIFELYDEHFLYRRFLRWPAKQSNLVVVPEDTRSDIFQLWLQLKEKPHVIPNKPYPEEFKPQKIDAKQAFRIRHNIPPDRLIILYQGHINSERDLSHLAAACNQMADRVQLVLLGAETGREVAKLREQCPDLVYLGFIDAPDHLEITAVADIGIVQYTKTSLNHLFCAPNKIWEYSKFGIPILGADLPSLRYTVTANRAGKLCNFSDSQSISRALNDMLLDLDGLSKGSSDLYCSVDIANLVQSAIETAVDEQ